MLYQEAIDDYFAFHTMNPDNKSVMKKIRKCKEELKKQEESEELPVEIIDEDEDEEEINILNKEEQERTFLKQL